MILAILAAAPLPAGATIFFPKAFTCPIGGEKFTARVIGSNSSFGARPDGKPYSPLPVTPIPECPGNGLLLFSEFTPEEIAILAPLVEGAEYGAMRTAETPYYRAWWLMRALGRPPAELAGTLLVASWETDGDPARKTRYQQAFADAAVALDLNVENGFYFGIRHANALRELGRFDEAQALLDRLAASTGWPADPDDRAVAEQWTAALRQLAAERNAHSEPTNMTPPMVAADRCVDESATRSPAEDAACARPAVQEAIRKR